MHTWFESSKRGGVAAGCEIRAAKANNPLLPAEHYDQSKPTTWLMAFDVNNLYGKALSSYLPIGGFNWMMDTDEWHHIQENPMDWIMKQKEEQDIGYHLEVDLSFPEDIHDKLKGLTPVPYQRKVQWHELSPFQQEMALALGVTNTSLSTSRLITDLYPRKNYVVHYCVLQFYLSLGIKLDCIHRGVSYRQAPTIRPYIERLANNRKLASEAGDSFATDMWKLAANAVYGKSVESVRKRCNFILCTNKERAMRYTKKPTFEEVIMLDDCEVALLRVKKLTVCLNKPLYLGVTVLDEAKRILYDWHYNVALPKWGDKFQSIATDTDSVYCLVETENIYHDMKEQKDKYDMYDYSPKCPVFGPYHDPTNHKVPGVMKDENAGRVMHKMTFLRPKMYNYTSFGALGTSNAGQYKLVQKAKGVPKIGLTELTPDKYEEVLLEPIQLYAEFVSILSLKHDVFTVEILKKSLNGFDVKRYILPDAVNTLPYGHKDIVHSDNRMKVLENALFPNALCS